jgi:hypothetical protein
MQPALVKIDVVAATLGVGVRRIEALVDGDDVFERGLLWVFDLANDRSAATRRELRFWWRESQQRLVADVSKQHKYANWELDWVIAQILPVRRKFFQAGEVDQLFQIRHNTRIEFGRELNGNLQNGANTYERANLATFLARRWLGAVSLRTATGEKFGQDGVGLKTTSREHAPAVRPSALKSSPAPVGPATTMPERSRSSIPAAAVAGGADTFQK